MNQTPPSLTCQPPPASSRRGAGYTLIELMVVVLVISIITLVAIPAYTRYVTKSRRAAAEACLSSYAEYLERFYTTNLRYDQDNAATPNAMNTAALTALNLSCAASQATGQYYSYGFASGQPTQSTYTLQAAPAGTQSTNDQKCGTLSLDQTGKRGISGTADLNTCWAH